jgi:hypothetical protein
LKRRKEKVKEGKDKWRGENGSEGGKEKWRGDNGSEDGKEKWRGDKMEVKRGKMEVKMRKEKLRGESRSEAGKEKVGKDEVKRGKEKVKVMMGKEKWRGDSRSERGEGKREGSGMEEEERESERWEGEMKRGKMDVKTGKEEVKRGKRKWKLYHTLEANISVIRLLWYSFLCVFTKIESPVSCPIVAIDDLSCPWHSPLILAWIPCSGKENIVIKSMFRWPVTCYNIRDIMKNKHAISS